METHGYEYNILKRFDKTPENIESIHETLKGIKIILKNKDVIWLNNEINVSSLGIMPKIKIKHSQYDENMINNGGTG